MTAPRFSGHFPQRPFFIFLAIMEGRSVQKIHGYVRIRISTIRVHIFHIPPVVSRGYERTIYDFLYGRTREKPAALSSCTMMFGRPIADSGAVPRHHLPGIGRNLFASKVVYFEN